MVNKKKAVKKVLIIASVPSMIGQFNMNNIAILQELNYEVHIACNFRDRSVWTTERVKQFISELKSKNISYYHIGFPRNPIYVRNDWCAYKQLETLVKTKKFDLIHCHTPVGGALGRIVAHKFRVKVIYTAHGFHFYDGAPLKNWLIYYPIEKFLSKYTDVLITINKEDYKRAKEKFSAKHTVYIPGVGVDTEKFKRLSIDVGSKRLELGVGEDDLMLLSVGELSPCENHEVVIRALARLPEQIRNHLKYFICGQGEMRDELISLSQSLNVNTILLGYRTDITELCCTTDLFLFPSKQEELPVALIEAIACKAPVICSNIRGNIDFVKEYLFEPDSVKELTNIFRVVFGTNYYPSIRKELNLKMKSSVINNYNGLFEHDIKYGDNEMRTIYAKNMNRIRMFQYFIQKKEFKKQYGIQKDAIILLSIGELNQNKNHKIVIEALSKLDDRRLNYFIAGTGDLFNTLREYADSVGVGDRVHLLGYQEDIPGLLNKADIYIHPSIREGLPVALMEAMATGLPVIASDIRGVHDLIQPGYGGWLVNPCNVSTLVSAIKQASIEHEKWNIIGYYNQSVIQKFSSNKVEEDMRNLYLKM